MSVKPEIEFTADGSHTLFVPELNEHYHSINGAIQESNHIFINTGLHCCKKQSINIFEIGFGTGLNAFLTLLNSIESKVVIHYTTVESYPLPYSIYSQLNYGVENRSLFDPLHQAEWNKNVIVQPNFVLQKIEADFTRFNFGQINNGIDLIYFDAFAPDKQPDMWTQQIFDSLYSISNDNAILVTYCAKGIVRRMMQQAGFIVERLPGPPGKREILRAIK